MSKQSPEEAVELLSRDMQYTLGCLAEQEDESLVGYTLDSLPFGTRSVLLACDAVEEPEVSAETGYSLRFTRFGREVAQACYDKHEGYIRYNWSELEELKSRREAAKLPEKLQQTLAVLACADDDTAETTLILLPVAEKQILDEHGAVELDWQDDICFVNLTDKGRQLMNACAFLQAPDWLKKQDQEFQQARREYWEGQFKNPTRPRLRPARKR